MVDPTKRPPRTRYAEIGGVRYGMLLDFNALCSIEDLTGSPIAALQGTGQVKDARAMLWAALNGWVRRDRPRGRTSFTVEAAGDIIDEWMQEPGGAEKMAKALAALGDAAFPEAAKGDDDADDDSGN